MKRDVQALAYVVLIGAALMLGFAPILVRFSEAGPEATAFWRFAIAAPVLIGAAFWRSGRLPSPGPRKDRVALVLCGVFFGLDMVFWHASITLTTVANATLLANLSPVTVVLASWFLFGEKPEARTALGGVAALIGAACLAGANLGIDPSRLTGDALGAITSVWYAGYILSVRRARASASALRVLVWTTVIGALVAGAATLLMGGDVMPETAAGWAVVALLALVVHVGGQGGMGWALGHVSAGVASVVILVQPVAAGLFGWILFGEALSALQWAGAGLALSGVALARPKSARMASTVSVPAGARSSMGRDPTSGDAP